MDEKSREGEKKTQKNILMGILSFIIPGLGQLIQGNFFEGIIFLAAAVSVLGIAFFFSAFALIIYLFIGIQSAINAYNFNSKERTVRHQDDWQKIYYEEVMPKKEKRYVKVFKEEDDDPSPFRIG